MDSFEKFTAKPWLSGPTRQHFVPRFYLEGFSSSCWLSVFDRASGEIRKQRPKNVAVVTNLYTFEDKYDRKRFDLEILFGQIESAAAPILKSLAEGRRINAAERETFAVFIGLAAARTPAAIEETTKVYEEFVKANSYLTMTDEEKIFNDLLKMKGPSANIPLLRNQARTLAKMAREGTYDVKIDKGYARSRSLKVMETISRALLNRDWMILHASSEGESFLTSDSPVTLLPTSTTARGLPIGYSSPHAQILFPLNSKSALVASGTLGRTGHCNIESEKLHRFNLAVAEHCHKNVFGGDEVLLKSITTELSLAGTVWQPKMSVKIQRFQNSDGSESSGATVVRKSV